MKWSLTPAALDAEPARAETSDDGRAYWAQTKTLAALTRPRLYKYYSSDSDDDGRSDGTDSDFSDDEAENYAWRSAQAGFCEASIPPAKALKGTIGFYRRPNATTTVSIGLWEQPLKALTLPHGKGIFRDDGSQLLALDAILRWAPLTEHTANDLCLAEKLERKAVNKVKYQQTRNTAVTQTQV